MPLSFPTNPSSSQTYQSGSSATYQYNGSFWTIIVPPTITTLNAVSASFVVTASYLDGSVPTLVQAKNTSAQSITTSTTTIITEWTNVLAQNATEWNATTGVFTATKAGTYLVSSNLTYAARSTAQSGNAANILIYKNSTVLTRVVTPALNTAAITRGLGTATAVINLAVGDTITIRTLQDYTVTSILSTTDGHNTITIQEIPSLIQR